jgi:hypothetical protein
MTDNPGFMLGLGLLIGVGLGALFMAIFTWPRTGAPPPRGNHHPCRCADCLHIFGWPPVLPSSVPPPPPPPRKPPPDHVNPGPTRTRGW